MEGSCSRFTPAEGGARLAASASEKNVLAVEHPAFIATRLVYEHAYKIRGLLRDGRQRSFHVTRSSRVPIVAYDYRSLTDLAVACAVDYDDVCDWSEELEEKEVIVCTSKVLKQLLEDKIISVANVNVLILESCHLVYKDENLKYILKLYKECGEAKRPRILALTYPLFLSTKKEGDPPTIDNSIDTPSTKELSDVTEHRDSVEDEIQTKKSNELVEIDSKVNTDATDCEDTINKGGIVTTNKESMDNEIDTITENIKTDITREVEKGTNINTATDCKETINKGLIVTTTNKEFVDNEIDTTTENITTDIARDKEVKDKVTNVDIATDCKETINKEGIVTTNKESIDNEINIDTTTENSIKTDIGNKEVDIEKGIQINTATDNKEININLDTATDCKEIINRGLIVKTTDKESIDTGTNIDTTDNKEKNMDTATEVKDNIDKPIKNTDKVDSNTIENKIENAGFGVYENFDDFDMYEMLEWKIEELEKEICCEMDLAEDIDGGKRLSAIISKPKELIIEYKSRKSVVKLPEAYLELEQYMKNVVLDAMEFLDDHRFDPLEIYGEDFKDELEKVPDPKIVPKYFLRQFLYVLEQLGPYAADKLAFSLLAKLEKLRVKEKYDRHFLLLCLLTTVFIKIRCYTDDALSLYADWDKIRIFSTPKLLRFIEILEKFQPVDDKNERTDVTTKLMNDLAKCDFKRLSNKIEDQMHTVEANLKDIVLDSNDRNTRDISANDSGNVCDSDKVDSKECKDIDACDIGGNGDKNDDVVIDDTRDSHNENDISENKCDSVGNKCDSVENKSDSVENKSDSVDKSLWLPKRQGRSRGRGRLPRSSAARAQQMMQNPDSLCGIVFMKEALMAKTMFLMIVDSARCNPKLAYLSVQYCAVDNPSDPCPDDTKRQGKKHEDVLKKFRMHECNLLLATSALEEGIDLPRCNLVLRWDVPASYRSYGLCRGRARAARSSNAILCCAGNLTATLLQNIATYRELDQIITRKCGCGIQDEPTPTDEEHADAFTSLIKPYAPQIKIINDGDTKTVIINKSDINTLFNKTKNDLKVKEKTINDNVSKAHVVNDNEVTKGVTVNDENESFYDVSVNDSSHKAKIDEDIDKETITNEVPVIDDNMSSEITVNDIHKEVMNNEESVNAINSETKSNEISFNDLNMAAIVNEATINDIQELRSNESFNDMNNYNEATVSIKNSEDTTFKDICTKEGLKVKINSELNNIDDIGNEIKILGDEISKMHINNKNNFNNTEEHDVNGYLKQNCDTQNIINDIRNRNDIQNCDSTTIRNDIGGNKNDTDISGDKFDIDDVANVDLSTAIPLINRYCAKLPSDTFTRLAPQWWIEEVQIPGRGSKELQTAYICTLRLPLNCPVKYNIVGHPMKTKVLARRMVALQACRILHKSGELDDQLMPIGKENFKAAELESNNFADGGDTNDAARPGTTKRRQYYYKRTASAFTDCQPIIDSTDAEIDSPDVDAKPKETKKGHPRNMLYALRMSLCCALPERYNTRGRRLHAPQRAQQAVAILMARPRPDNLQIPAFPVYTRSGEVRVSVEYVPDADVRLSPRRAKLIRRFMRFVFAEVLRVHRRGMKLQSEGSTHNNYYVVPTIKSTREDGTQKIDIDWQFLELIYNYTEDKKQVEIDRPVIWEEEKEKKKDKPKNTENPLLKSGEVFEFDPDKYKEAVVTPWYRNQDQPQFFLVAEICWNLTPESAFPSAAHSSFRHYYGAKYGVSLTQPRQPLLDVDHTSARLNLLTPRYVNRKGVALPVSSERTRRAKRDRLDQKQILVPELCRVHPFAAPLWFATVALPCVLYRINALLIADEIRRAVAIDVGLGISKIDDTNCPGFQWPPLDFGWSLAEVLNADSEKDKKKEEDVVEEDKRPKSAEDKPEMTEIDIVGQKEKTINDILQEKENAENTFEIGTWSNDMAYNIPSNQSDDEFMEPFPCNVTLVTSESGGVNWSEKPKSQFIQRNFSMADSDCSYMSSDFDTDTDSDDSYEDSIGFGSGKTNTTFPAAPSSFRIEYKTAHEAEAFDLERKKVNPAPQPDIFDDERDRKDHDEFVKSGGAPIEHIKKFRESVAIHKKGIIENDHLIDKDQPIITLLPEFSHKQPTIDTRPVLSELFPYSNNCLELLKSGQISIESIEKNKRTILEELKSRLPSDEIKKLKCFSMVDVNIDAKGYVNEKLVNVGFDMKEVYEKKVSSWESNEHIPYYQEGVVKSGKEFDFDYQPTLEGHPGPSPSVILQALTMSNANDGINLERLETIGDSFLKFAITAYLYCAHPTVHEGKLSHMRSKQVSNLNLYRLGRNKRLGARMIASKFEPHDNWLPPCYKPPPTLHSKNNIGPDQPNKEPPTESTGCFIPYNLITQHSIPDKSIADCVEALIGAYLLEMGPRGALLFMSWLGIRVLPRHDLPLPKGHPYVVKAEAEGEQGKPPSEASSEPDSEGEARQEAWPDDWAWPRRPVGSLRPYNRDGRWMQPIYGELKAPPSPLLRYIEDPEGELEQMLSGYDALERTLQYRFKDRSLLLQALTHASHQSNRLTDCYQRLEFLGDAILDYLITRHLYEEPRRHSPGALTDLRSALVNNTIFATLAARHGFHKYFRHMSPGLNEVLTKYVKIQEENGHSISEEHYLIQEDEMEQAEDVEVPKALGDLFESVAGAIFLDSGMSLGAVWKSYVNLMGAELEAFSAAAPKSPVRELLEAEPDTAKFGKPERLADGRRVRVSVEVFGRGTFKGIGRNYRIAKGTAARCALRHLKLLHKGR